jgi:ElaA protein
MTTAIKHFKDLSPEELYEILKLRVDVFVVEQDCAYSELDDKDKKALHLMLHQDGELSAYARLLPTGVSYPNYNSIGRVVVSPKYRGQQLGYLIMNKAIEYVLKHFEGPLKLSAQAHLIGYYGNLGFEPTADEYFEDGIPHICMVYKRD